jgi:hypothetical protein
MRINRGSRFAIPAAVLLLTLTLVPAAAPDVWNKHTNVHFGEPVEFPGGVVVPAGDYVMKLADSPSNRNIVQVLNQDQNRVYATVLTIPTQRSEPAEKTIITFYETPGGDPQYVHKWFYPGDTRGQEFPYPKGRTSYIAQASSLSGPAADTDQQTDAATSAAPVETKAPEGAETSSESAAPIESAPEPEAAPSPSAPAEQTPEPAQAEPEQGSAAGQMKTETMESKPADESKLPATASIVPEVALAGGLFLLTALVLAVTRRVALRRGVEPPEEW